LILCILDNPTPQRLIDINVISSNRHDVSIIWLDTKMDPKDLRTQQLLNQLNDKVELFNDIRDCMNVLYQRQETILLIVSGKCAAQCLRSIHSLISIDSIIIFCASPQKYPQLTNDTYSKILACITTETELIQYVHTWIDLKCQTHFYTWNNDADNPKQLTRQTALFLANHLLPNAIQLEAYSKLKQEMLKICYAYYAQRPSELNHIREFDLTYTPADAIMWYTRDSFVHKIVNRALRSFDSAKLRALAFYIRDLRAQLCEWRFTTSSKEPLIVYHGLVMTQCDINRIQSTPIGSLLSTNGFLSTSQKREIAEAFATKKQNTIGQPLRGVLLEINLNVDNSPIIFADVGHISDFPEEGEILFDIRTVLCLQNVEYDDESKLFTIKLTIATQNDYNLIEQLLKSVKYQLNEQFDEGGELILIGKLLNVHKQFDEQFKKHEEKWHKFSLFLSSFNSLWHLNQDKCKVFIEEHMPWIVNFLANLYRKLIFGIVIYLFIFSLDRSNKIDKCNSSKKYDLVQYNEISSARFEPVLFFFLNNELMEQEQKNLSTIFSLQYRRFITKHLTLSQIETNLNEFYLIYYISSEEPLCIKNNPRIKFYQLNLSDTINKIKSMERLISRLLHDLGIFYPEQAKNLTDQQQDKIMAKRLLVKGAKCYELLASETDKTIQRYTKIDEVT
jgi:hypothetical protein